MSARNTGRLVLTFLLAFFGFGGIPIDGNATHLFHPDWPPHARYHLVMGFVAFAALGGAGLWLLWRPGQDARLHLRLAVLACAALTGSLFVAALVPGTGTLYGPEVAALRVGGLALPPNMIAAGLALLALPPAYRSARRDLGRRTGPAPSLPQG